MERDPATVGHVKDMLVKYYNQTKHQNIHQESTYAQDLYDDLLVLTGKDNKLNLVFANSDIIAKTERHYRQHFLDRFETKNKDCDKKNPITLVQRCQVRKALQLGTQQPQPSKASASKPTFGKQK